MDRLESPLESEPSDCPGLLNRGERKYSLYSTDTEERIISVDKGLDRCAAVLQSLLAEGGNMMMEDGRTLGTKEKPFPAWKRGSVCKTKSCRSVKDDASRPTANDGCRKRVDGGTRVPPKKTVESNCVAHPAACSTPDRKPTARTTVLHNAAKDRHVPTKVEERERLPWKGAPLQKRLPSFPQAHRSVQQEGPATRPNTGEQKKACTPHCKCVKPGQVKGDTHTPPPPPFLSCCHSPYGYPPWLPLPYPFSCCPYHHHQYLHHGCSSGSQQSLGGGPPLGKTNLRTSARKSELRKMDALDLASLQCWPPAPRVPPMDYYQWYYGTHGFQPSHGQHSSGQPPLCCDVPSASETQCNKSLARLQREKVDGHHTGPSLREPDALVDRHQHTHTTDRDTPSTQSHFDQKPTTDHRLKPHPQPLSTHSELSKSHSLHKPSSDQGPVKIGVTSMSESNRAPAASTRVSPSKLEEVSDLQGLQDLLKNLMTCCEENIRNIRASSNGVMGTRLAHLGEMVTQVKSHLVEQCHNVVMNVRQGRLNQKSVADWLAQTQQLEEEKAGLIERLKESCTAYSELRKKLDCAEEEKQEKHKRGEDARREVASVRAELEAVMASLRLKEAVSSGPDSSCCKLICGV